eukprot:TRINITY_DN49499_c0_g1_i1.p1 TRINITY_DN49499_c0_g1~~TRINITY_DN49499_c0_g1_i1.p1  ORF type:complete len:129 (-),score=6.67 TRINITY_DN49499_c0_g1_i1:2-337(-)
MVDALSRLSTHTAYKAPTPTQLAGEMLTAATASMDEAAATSIAKHTKFGLSLTSDGWTDTNGDYLLNFIIMPSKTSHYASNLLTPPTISKTKQWVADTVIHEVNNLTSKKT